MYDEFLSFIESVASGMNVNFWHEFIYCRFRSTSLGLHSFEQVMPFGKDILLYLELPLFLSSLPWFQTLERSSRMLCSLRWRYDD